ncbi:hypothetical protein BLOT_010066 [Blomia tropicalis]|nr:hypothetical protein BLOT_010066 [Blomia tropicalis]
MNNSLQERFLVIFEFMFQSSTSTQNRRKSSLSLDEFRFQFSLIVNFVLCYGVRENQLPELQAQHFVGQQITIPWKQN